MDPADTDSAHLGGRSFATMTPRSEQRCSRSSFGWTDGIDPNPRCQYQPLRGRRAGPGRRG